MGDRVCFAEYEGGEFAGTRDVWWDGKLLELIVTVCGAWRYPRTITVDPVRITCPDCSDAIEARTAEELRRRDW